jgi:hypothetical protein
MESNDNSKTDEPLGENSEKLREGNLIYKINF